MDATKPPLADIARFFEVDHAVPVGNGAVGIAVVLRALGARGTRVAIPAMTCPTVAMAVMAAGAEPLLVEVSERDANLSVDALERSLDGSVSAIVAVDAYGYPADWQALRRVADERGCALVADACQSYGGYLDGRPLGSFGDAAVISFGYSKAIWLDRGGMVLTGDAGIAGDVRRLLAAPDVGLLSPLRSRAYLRLMRADRLGVMRDLSVRAGLLRQRMPRRVLTRLTSRWPAFVAGLGETKRRLHDLGAVVSDAGLGRRFDYDDVDWLPWRWTFLAEEPGRRAAIRAALEAGGLPTSALYDTADRYFAQVPAGREVTVTRRVADSLVNLKSLGSYCATLPDVAELRRRLRRAADRLGS